MDNPDLTQINIQISADDATDEDIDRMTRQLLAELREMNIESAKLAKAGPAPLGSKGDSATVGSIIIDVLPAVLPALIAFVQAWTTRGQGRNVKFKGRVNRKLIEFEGSPEEFMILLEKLKM